MTKYPRIGIDYTAAIHQGAGIGRSVRELVRALVGTEPGIPLELFVAGARGIELPPPPGHSTYHPSKLSERNHARLWHRLNLPIPVEWWTGKLDLFHSPDFTLPPTQRDTKTIVTIHDLAFEKFPNETMPGMLAHLKRTVPKSIEQANRVIAVSEATRQDIRGLYGTPQEKITVIHHGVASRFNARHDPQEDMLLRTKYRLPAGGLILTLGTLQPRKNHLRLVQAFAQMTPISSMPTGYEAPTLVIAGPPGWDYDTVKAEVQRLKLEDRVVFTGRVDDEDLPALYRAAMIFAYPALYEGFGLPVLEAMACGVPVIAANTSSLPEVAGEAGLLVDPHDVGAISAALDLLLADESLRAEMSRAGVVQARHFTWARTAQATWDVYESVLGRGS